MKRILIMSLTLTLLLSGCKPIPAENESGIPIQEEIGKASADNEDIGQPIFPKQLNTTVKYYDSEILIDAQVQSLQRDDFYTYKITEAYLPKVDEILSVFPELTIDRDKNGYVLPNTAFSDGDVLVNISAGTGSIVVRRQFASEEKVDNEYNENDSFDFNISYDEAKQKALEVAKAILDEDNLKINSVKKFGKHTKENYYIFSFSAEYDGVTFSSYGKKLTVGKDSEGYNKTVSLRGGNGITVYMDEYGISQVSWTKENVERYEKVGLLNFDELLDKYSSQILLFSMNNFAQFENNSDQTYKKGTMKTYTVFQIEMLYAKDFISQEDINTDNTMYIPCWKFISLSEKGKERYTIVNAVTGEILVTSLGA